MKEVYSILWAEKYRPKTINELILKESEKEIFQNYINEKTIPNLILYGDTGTGKTSCARILIDSILEDESDCIIFNGSTSTGIENIRENVSEFISSMSMSGSKIKIVFFDEADRLSNSAQDGLRNIIETYSDIARFIFTANYPEKISKAIHSRCKTFEFHALPKTLIENKIDEILQIESIEPNKAYTDKIVSMYYPDMRKILGTLQSVVCNGKFVIDVNDQNINNLNEDIRDIVLNICKYILSNQDKGIPRLEDILYNKLRDNTIDYNNLYKYLFEDKTIPYWAKIHIVNYLDTSSSVIIPAMHFMAMVYQIIKTGVQMRNLK